MPCVQHFYECMLYLTPASKLGLLLNVSIWQEGLGQDRGEAGGDGYQVVTGIAT
jgi:hypothetical protein